LVTLQRCFVSNLELEQLAAWTPDQSSRRSRFYTSAVQRGLIGYPLAERALIPVNVYPTGLAVFSRCAPSSFSDAELQQARKQPEFKNAVILFSYSKEAPSSSLDICE
jgi:hypothetical protein